MKRSYFFKSFLLTILLIFMSFMILGGSVFAVVSRYALNDARADARIRLERSADELSRIITAHVRQYGLRLREFQELHTVMQAIARINRQEILLFNEQGAHLVSVLLDTSELNDANVPMALIDTVVDQGHIFSVNALPAIFSGSHITVGIPVPVAVNISVAPWNVFRMETYTFVLLLTASYDEQRGVLLHFFLRAFLWVGLFTLLAALLVAYWTSRRMTKPLADMAEAARSFGRGDFSVRLGGGERCDELGELTVSFNAMAESLGHAEGLRRDFIDNISHELRTPMTTIAGTVDGILDGTIADNRRDEYLGTVSGEVRRLSRLVARLTDLTRMDSESGHLEIAPFDLSETARRVLLSFEARIHEKELPVTAAFSDGPLLALGDADAVTQIIHNLLENAVKFSTPGEPFMVSVTRSGDSLAFSVENGGPGILPDDLPYVFDRFFKADRSRSADKEGMGLGLYLAKSMLRGMNGDLRAFSANGRTRFMFTLDEAARM